MRLFLTFLLFVSIFVFPWYLSALLGLYLIIRYQAFEVLIAAFCYDLLYGVSGGAFFWGMYAASASALLAFLIVLPIKRQTRFASV